MLEKNIEAHLKRLCERHGAIVYKFTSSEAGVPDRIIVHNGKVYLVELKREGGELSAIQEHQHTRLSRAGVDVHVLWSFDDVEEFVETVIE